MLETNLKIITELKAFLNYLIENENARKLIIKGENDFTRNRKLTIEKLVLFLINLSRKTLTVEIKEFFDLLGIPDMRCTKSAFTQQRKKLCYLFFELWNYHLSNCFYNFYGNKIKTWNSFRLLGIDGSTLYLANTKELTEYFGVQENQHGGKTMARTLFVYDVLNEIAIYSKIRPIKTSESTILCPLIESIPDDAIAIYDRGFPSYKNMFLHICQEKEKKFVMRCSVTQNKTVIDFVNSGKRNQIVEFTPNDEAIKQLYQMKYHVTKKTSIKVRLIRIELDDGSIEILATNLYDSKIYPTSQFKFLYFQRWKVETGINYFKNLYQIELFSGNTVESVHQDFYATIFTFNLHSILIKQCKSGVHKISQNRKYEYKINRAVTLGFIKGDLIRLFTNSNPVAILKKMEKEFLTELIPIRNNRKYKRIKKVKRLNGKYQTLTNYKQAI